jgi:hypothetical protein
MRKRFLFAGLMTLISMLLVVIVVIGTAPDYFTEDFTSKQYCDTLNTTALWDTISGELKLPPFELTLAGSYNTTGSARGVTIEGDYAYVAGLTAGLQVIDISDPTSPSLAGSYDTPGYAFVVAIAGDYAYVTDEASGLQVIDISDPTNPTLAGNYATSAGAYGVAIAGDYAYVAAWTAGLEVLDISDPTNPSLAGSYDTPGSALGVAVDGDYAYVADYASGLRVIDISDPTNPSPAGSYVTPGNAWVVVIDGNYAYVADQGSGLVVIDISDPTNPSLAGSYDTPGAAYGVSIDGDYAYVADYTSGLQAIDISDPTNPSLIYSYDTPNYAYDVAVSGEHAYVADYSSGLQVIDICDAMSPMLAGSYHFSGVTNNIAISGDYAYVANHAYGLQILDISDPTSPSFAGNHDTPDVAGHVSISGDYAYVSDSDSGLQVVDISDPTNPSLAGSYDPPGPNTGGVVISGDYAYMPLYNIGLHVIDISDPTSPSSAGDYSSLYDIRDVAISGDYAYVIDHGLGLQVLDITDPTNPTYAGSLSTPDISRGIAISGDYAYVADEQSGLQVIDISDPTNPSSAGSYDTPGYAAGVAISGDYAYVADGSHGLQVIDISDPTNPSLSGSYDIIDNIFCVTTSGDYAFITRMWSGPLIIQVFQRIVDPSENRAYSTVVHSSSDYILAARLSTSQTESIVWYINGTEVLPGDFWTALFFHSKDLVWSARLEYSTPNVNPTCSELTIELLGPSPLADSISDIPNDQGKQVSFSWTRSGYDYVGSPTPITEYAIYRKIDYTLFMSLESKEQGINDADIETESNGQHSRLAYPPGDWHYLTTVPARCEDTYSTVVPTLADSTIFEGMYQTTFFVRARTATPGIYFDSEPDSGYSVDNLAPTAPQGFSVAYNSGEANDLAWEECPDTDFKYFCIYRGESEDFIPDPGNLVHTTTGTSWRDEVDEAYNYCYKTTSVDFSGNESDPTGPVTTTDAIDVPDPKRFALYQNVPNPFNPTTVIQYVVPGSGGHVKLRIYDVGGRLIKTLVNGAEPPGRKSVVWDGRDEQGVRAASGVYFYRLEALGNVKTRKMILLK